MLYSSLQGQDMTTQILWKMVIRMLNTKQQEVEIFKLTGESMIGVAAVILVTVLL